LPFARGFRTDAMALSSACALLRVSSHSRSGIESATIPAPAWTEAVPLACPDRNSEIHPRPASADVPDGSGIRTARHRLQLVDYLHRPNLGRAGHRAGGKSGAEDVERRHPIVELTFYLTHDVQHVRVLLHFHELGDFHSPVFRHPPHVVTTQIDKHHVLGALLLIREQLRGDQCVVLRRFSTRPRAGDRAERDSTVRDSHQQLG